HVFKGYEAAHWDGVSVTLDPTAGLLNPFIGPDGNVWNFNGGVWYPDAGVLGGWSKFDVPASLCPLLGGVPVPPALQHFPIMVPGSAAMWIPISCDGGNKTV